MKKQNDFEKWMMETAGANNNFQLQRIADALEDIADSLRVLLEK